MKFRISGNLKLAASLVIIGGMIFGGVYQINKYAVEGLLRQDARETSMSVAEFFGKNLPGIADIIAGEHPSSEAQAFIAAGIEAKDVDLFKLYSPDGKLVLSTGPRSAAPTAKEALGNHNPAALNAIRQKRPFVKLETEMEDGKPEFIAETYVPIVMDGKVAGGAEVYINQTALANGFRQSFAWASAVIALLAAAGFAAPAYGFHLRSRQKSAADENVRYLATHDALTGLANRASFAASLSNKLNGARNKDHLVALHFVDLDFFKEVNDQYGHEFGDQVLRTVAARMTAILRDGDIVSRFGGDEFVIAQFGIADHEVLANATARIVKVFETPLSIDDREVTVKASIGTSVSAMEAGAAERLIANADTAVYVVKARGRNGHCFFESRFDEEKRKRHAIEVLMRDAVANDRFELHYQPLVKLTEGRLKGFEALLRLRGDDGTFIPPSDIIPIAEETGLIDEIGSWVLGEACRAAAGWPQELQVSVNLSAAQFRRRSVVDVTRKALDNSGLDPGRLLLEITESLLLSDTDAVIDQLLKLKALGVSIAMDDFGTGYSSLSYMLKLPFDLLKIDKSFVQEIKTGSESARTVIQTIIAMGHTLGMTVTAEGVETEVQAQVLLDLRCDDAQGYLFAKPMPATDIPALLMKSFAADISDAELPQVQHGATAAA